MQLRLFNRKRIKIKPKLVFQCTWDKTYQCWYNICHFWCAWPEKCECGKFEYND